MKPVIDFLVRMWPVILVGVGISLIAVMAGVPWRPAGVGAP